MYELLLESGPPHAKEFKFKCSVSNVADTAIARTKKQAKHQAAYAVWTKLRNLFGEEVNPVALVVRFLVFFLVRPPVGLLFHSQTDEKTTTVKQDDEVNQKYLSLCKTQRVPGSDSSHIINHYRAYSRLVERSPMLMKIELGEPWEDNPVETLTSVADDLGVQATLKVINGSRAGDIYLAGLPVSPLLFRSGASYEEAAEFAMKTLLSFL